MAMAVKVLVAYGSKYGSTAEIAGRIGDVLSREGLEADVSEAGSAGGLQGYAAVVVGSGVYYGRWRRPAASFLKKNRELLAGIPVWIFSSGPAGEGDPLGLTDGWLSPKSLQRVIDAIQPEDLALFHGKVDPEKINAFERWAMKKVDSPTGDFRDWDTIAEWAARIAKAL